jgi:hypothetical protein
MDYEMQPVEARIAEGLLVPDCIPDAANPLSGVYMQFYHPHDSELTLVALRRDSFSGNVEGRVDGVFPRMVHNDSGRIRRDGAIPPVGDTPPFMLETAVAKAEMYGEIWAREDGFEEGSYVVAIKSAFSRPMFDPRSGYNPDEWNFELPDRLGGVFLYAMTETPDGKTISRRKDIFKSSKRHFLPEEDCSWVATIKDAVSF